jgi:hypothetical protein
LFDQTAILDAAQQHRIQTVLGVELTRKSAGGRLHHDDAAIELSLAVQTIDHPVRVGTQKISGAVLEHTFPACGRGHHAAVETRQLAHAG